MRIALWHDLPPGGGRRALGELTRWLAAQHTVDAFACGDEDSSPMLEMDGVRTERVPFAWRPHRRYALYWNDWLTFQDLQDLHRLEEHLAEQIDHGHYHVALVSTLRFGQAPGVLRYLRTPSAYYCHEPPRRFSEPWCRPEAGPLSPYERARQLWRWPAQAALDALVRARDLEHVRCATVVLTNSKYTRGRIRAAYGRDAELCYLGVDTRRFSPLDGAPAARSVISVGALEAHKGFDFVIRALGRIPRDRRPALTVVGWPGHPRMPAYLSRLAEGAGVSLRVCSAISDSELVSLYRSSALFVFGAHFEPFGLVLLEAMACGLPVVAVNEGGVTESVVDGVSGQLVPRDEAAFADAVDELLSAGALRRAMGRAGREAVEASWTWEAAACRLGANLERIAVGSAVAGPVGAS